MKCKVFFFCVCFTSQEISPKKIVAKLGTYVGNEAP